MQETYQAAWWPVERFLVKFDLNAQPVPVSVLTAIKPVPMYIDYGRHLIASYTRK